IVRAAGARNTESHTLPLHDALPIWPVPPELDGKGRHPVAGPVRWPRYRISLVAAFELREPALQLFPRAQRRALIGCPGGELREARPGREVCVRFRVADQRRLPFEADLGLEIRPPARARHVGVRVDVPSFERVGVCVEYATLRVDLLQQHE